MIPIRYAGELMFRLLGVLSLLLAIKPLRDLLTLLAYDVDFLNLPLAVLGHGIPLVLLLAGGMTLILGARTFAASSLPEGASTAESASAADVHSILFSIAGVVLVGLSVTELPRIVYNLAVFYSDHPQQGFVPGLRRQTTDTWLWLGGELLQMGLGFFLIVRGSNLVTLLRRRFDRSPALGVDERCPHCGDWIDWTQYREGATAHLCGNCKQELPAPSARR